MASTSSRRGQAGGRPVADTDGSSGSKTAHSASVQVTSEAEQAATLGDQAAALFYDRLFAIDPLLRRLFRSDPAAQWMKLLSILSMLQSS